MNQNQHIIQKQFVHLSVSRRENTLVVQQRFERMLEEQLMPRLEPIFDRLAGPGVWVEMDRLDIDLGYLKPEEPEAAWLEKTFQAYVEALEDQVRKPEDTKRSSSAQNTFEVLSYFLKKGYFPWWAGIFDLEAAILKEMPFMAGKILDCLISSTARRRWVRQFKGKTQQALFQHLSKNQQDQLPISLSQWQKWLPELSKQKVGYLYWETVWEALHKPDDFKNNWLKGLMHQTLSVLPKGQIAEAFQHNIRQNAQLTGSEKKQLLQAAGQDIKDTEKALSKQPAKRHSALDSEGIYVSLAGIVLLHPFLPAFFQRLGLLEEEHFCDETARERAVHLLYFLATGQQHPAEQETVLLKLLCGMELETPIEKEIDLKNTEKAEAVHLLESLVRQWEAIEGSTADELRGSFFIRDGKLQISNMGWRLTIEVKSYDLLLNQLPWGLSPIMHPWMKEMIWVDWA